MCLCVVLVGLRSWKILCLFTDTVGTLVYIIGAWYSVAWRTWYYFLFYACAPWLLPFRGERFLLIRSVVMLGVWYHLDSSFLVLYSNRLWDDGPGGVGYECEFAARFIFHMNAIPLWSSSKMVSLVYSPWGEYLLMWVCINNHIYDRFISGLLVACE